ncbi:MAG: hypothetical protein K2X93_25085 [Candidatus Obscuribacterales bacterium]|nr:hypothetical protein [Candidatus Obscuribacterales bacterium]
MKNLLVRMFRPVVEVVATIVVCLFIFALFGGLGASLSENNRFRGT